MDATPMDFLRYTLWEVIEVFVMLKNNYFPCFKPLNNYWRLNIYEKDKFMVSWAWNKYNLEARFICVTPITQYTHMRNKKLHSRELT